MDWPFWDTDGAWLHHGPSYRGALQRACQLAMDRLDQPPVPGNRVSARASFPAPEAHGELLTVSPGQGGLDWHAPLYHREHYASIAFELGWCDVSVVFM